MKTINLKSKQGRYAFFFGLVMLFSSFKSPVIESVTLNAGTLIPLETVSTIKSDLVTVGQVLDFRVTRDIVAEGKVVIPAGSIANGQVIRGQRAKGLGKAGFLEVQIKSVKSVDGQDIYLAGGNVYEEGEDKAALAIILGLFVCILLLTIKGKNAEIPAGFAFNASVGTTTTIAI